MSNVSLHSLLSRRLAAGLAAAAARDAVCEDEGLETVAEMTRVFIVEEEGGGWGWGSGWLTLRKLMERCGNRGEISWENCPAVALVGFFRLSDTEVFVPGGSDQSSSRGWS